jgi:hypothetical protein
MNEMGRLKRNGASGSDLFDKHRRRTEALSEGLKHA